MKNIEDKLKLLVVEDTPQNLAIARDYFNQKNLDVDYATCREEAIEMIKKIKYSGLITDRSIPGEKNEDISILSDKVKQNFMKYQGMISDSMMNNFISAYVEGYPASNGHKLTLIAESLNLPWVLASEHGGLLIGSPQGKKLAKNDALLSKLDYFVTKYNNLELEKRNNLIGPEFYKNQLFYTGTFNQLINMINLDEGVEFTSDNIGLSNNFDYKEEYSRGLRKTNSESWEKAFNRLQERINIMKP